MEQITAVLQGQVGPQAGGDGASFRLRQTKTAALVVAQLHGKFAEQALRGNLFSGGMTLTSVSNVTFTSGTLGATCTPIAGVWNPITSTVNLVVLQAALGITVTNATNTGTGPFVWAVSTGNGAISTGNAPLNRRTMVNGGSQAKDMTGVALTGLTNNLVVKYGSSLNGGSAANFSFVGTAAGQVTTAGGTNIEDIGGAFIVPPGGVLALLGTTTGVAHSAAAGLLWEEVPA